jgi:hypothetical protein
MKNKGMTLFIAITVTAVLLFISFVVVNIAIKGSLFASSGRNSQYAFYAADAGVECAIYWDSRTDTSKFDTDISGSPISCGGHIMSTGQAITGTSTLTLIGGGGPSQRTSSFGFVLDQGGSSMPSCVVVTVEKRLSDGKTYINSRGYNTCDVSNPRRFERGIEVDY